MTITITRALAEDLLAEAIETRGADYSYEAPETSDVGTCYYWHGATNEPGCIIGLVLRLAGVSDETIQAADVVPPKGASHAGTTITSVVKRNVLGSRGVLVEDEALNLLSFVQAEQDQGVKWGTAVRRALQETRVDEEDEG